MISLHVACVSALLSSSSFASLVASGFRLFRIRRNILELQTFEESFKWQNSTYLIRIFFSKKLVEKVLGPDDAVDGLAGGIANGATGEGLLVRFGLALVALSDAFLDDRDLAEIPGSAGLDERDVCGETHPVDVVSRGAVVQGVEAESELFEEAHTVLYLHDGVVVGHNVAARGKSVKNPFF